jgi:hypothetical protein
MGFIFENEWKRKTKKGEEKFEGGTFMLRGVELEVHNRV